MKKARGKSYRRQRIREAYNYLREKIGDTASVMMDGERNALVLDAIKPYELWEKLADACSDTIVLDCRRISLNNKDLVLVEAYCVSIPTKIYIRFNRIINFLTLSPIFLLYDRRMCTKGLKQEMQGYV